MQNYFWQPVELVVPQRVPSPDKVQRCKSGVGRPPEPAHQVFKGIVYVLRTAAPVEGAARGVFR